MRYLLDTHTILWSIYDNNKLNEIVKAMINNEDNDIYYSVISPWEVEIKHHKNPNLMPISGHELMDFLDTNGYKRIDIKAKHINELSNLKEKDNSNHKDPFDRMLLAQAKAENIALLTHDKKFKAYDEIFVLVF